MDKAIIVDHLSYQDRLKDVSFTIQKGEIVSFVGLDNSGNDTILKIISGLKKPDSGFVSALGYDPYLGADDFKKNISFMNFENNFFLRNCLPIEILEITKEIYGLSDREFNKNINELTQFVKNPDLLDSLIYRPKIVLAENPDNILDLLYKYNNKEDSSVLFTSSKIDNLVNVVRRIILFDKGDVLYDGSIEELIKNYANEKVIKAKVSLEIDTKLIESIGSLSKYLYPYVYIKVPRSVTNFAAAEIMQTFPVTNISIEELSVAEIIENIKK